MEERFIGPIKSREDLIYLFYYYFIITLSTQINTTKNININKEISLYKIGFYGYQ